MLGLLKIMSARAPYRRAGLAWADREPKEVDIRQLDGGRLKALLLDPVLTISVADRMGMFRVVPETHRAEFAEEADRLIANAIEALPPLTTETPEDPIAAELDEVAAKLKAAGFASLDPLIQAHADLVEQLKAEREAHDATKLSLATAETRATQLDADVAKLKGEIDKLKAEKPTTTKTKTPKPAGTDT